MAFLFMSVACSSRLVLEWCIYVTGRAYPWRGFDMATQLVHFFFSLSLIFFLPLIRNRRWRGEGEYLLNTLSLRTDGSDAYQLGQVRDNGCDVFFPETMRMECLE